MLHAAVAAGEISYAGAHGWVPSETRPVIAIGDPAPLATRFLSRLLLA
jgi:hypothetical protein